MTTTLTRIRAAPARVSGCGVKSETKKSKAKASRISVVFKMAMLLAFSRAIANVKLTWPTKLMAPARNANEMSLSTRLLAILRPLGLVRAAFVVVVLNEKKKRMSETTTERMRPRRV